MLNLEALMNRLVLSFSLLLIASGIATAQTNYALSFNGSSAFVDLPYTSSAFQPTGGNFSAEAWIYIAADAGTDQKVFMTLGGWARGYAMNVYNDGAGYYFTAGIYLNGHNYFASDNSTFIPTETWTHVAMTWNQAGDLIAYVNGVETNRISTEGYSYSSSLNKVTIGVGYTNMYYAYFKGKIDELRVWNTTRSASEIFDNMNAELAGSETGLVAYYKMSDGSGTTLSDDQSSGSNPGTISNATWVSSDSPLPVELTSFAATPKGRSVELVWETASEVDNYGFEIERSPAGSTTWENIGFVSGNGSTNIPHSYSYTDVTAVGPVQYRLKQINRDGSFEYSQTVAASPSMIKVLELDQNYPNPFNPATNISFTVPTNGHAVLTVVNILGQRVATLFNGEAEAGRMYQASFDASGFAAGLYFSRLEHNGTVKLKKMQLIK